MCPKGYKYHQGNCHDVNECELPDTHPDAPGCQHFCVNHIGYSECDCDYGFTLSSDNKTCLNNCLDPNNEVWDAARGACVVRPRTCSSLALPAHEADRFRNLDMVGSGYDLIRGDPLTDADPGIRRRIFSPTAYDGEGYCVPVGYELSHGESCRSISDTRAHKSTLSLLEAIEEFAETLSAEETPSVTITESLDNNLSGSSEIGNSRQNTEGQFYLKVMSDKERLSLRC